MKSFVILFAILSTFPLFASAQISSTDMQQEMMQKLQSMSPEERQAMVDSLQKNTQAIKTCLNDAGGEEALQELQTLNEAHQKQVKDMCQKGKRQAAQAYAQDASKEMLQDPRVSKLRNCSRMALQNMPQLAKIAEFGGIDTNKHVCD